MWLAFVLMLTIFHYPKAETFCLATILTTKKTKKACKVASIFFSRKKARQTKHFCLRMMKNHPHQQKGKPPHTQEKFQDAAISVEDKITIFTGLNLCGAHCTVECKWLPGIYTAKLLRRQANRCNINRVVDAMRPCTHHP
jgi:hypothetical protein